MMRNNREITQGENWLRSSLPFIIMHMYCIACVSSGVSPVGLYVKILPLTYPSPYGLTQVIPCGIPYVRHIERVREDELIQITIQHMFLHCKFVNYLKIHCNNLLLL